jgi:acetoin utilization deacetylase AcuC-like enzyme
MAEGGSYFNSAAVAARAAQALGAHRIMIIDW